jgi:hypothetical protein
MRVLSIRDRPTLLRISKLIGKPVHGADSRTMAEDRLDENASKSLEKTRFERIQVMNLTLKASSGATPCSP